MGRAFLVPIVRYIYGTAGGIVGALCAGSFDVGWPLAIALIVAGILTGRALGALETL